MTYGAIRAWAATAQRTPAPGYGGQAVLIGVGQARVLGQLRAVRNPHPSRLWTEAPRFRELRPSSPGSAHRDLSRLAALGVVAVQTIALGCLGGVRFTFGVRLRRPYGLRRGLLAAFAPVAGQVGAFDEPADELPPAKPPDPPKVDEPDARRRRERPSFGELMERYGFDRSRLVTGRRP
jgi:hypothetical protein